MGSLPYSPEPLRSEWGYVMGAQAKTINLLMNDGNLQGVVTIEDSAWNSGEMYSAPRESVRELLDTEACNKYGIYLLISHDRVYVGQSSDLAKRLTQHLSGKDWWTSALILTTTDNSLSRTDIDWLEYSLIERARFVGRLDCDNIQKGNPVNVSRFREVWLSQYLDEALFLIELIGIPVFVNRPQLSSSASGARIDVTDVHNRLAFGKRLKGLAVQYVTDHGLKVTDNSSYAVLNERGAEFFLNPTVDMPTYDWTLILNDTAKHMLVVFTVPANTLSVSDDVIGALKLRRDKQQYLDLHINPDNFIDRRSGVDFSDYLIGRIAY